jgi:hypothetical protein
MLATKMTELVPTLQSELNRVTCDLCHASKIKSFNGLHPEDSLQLSSGSSNGTPRYLLLAYSRQPEASTLINSTVDDAIKKAGITSRV